MSLFYSYGYHKMFGIKKQYLIKKALFADGWGRRAVVSGTET